MKKENREFFVQPGSLRSVSGRCSIQALHGSNKSNARATSYFYSLVHNDLSWIACFTHHFAWIPRKKVVSLHDEVSSSSLSLSLSLSLFLCFAL